MPPMPAVEGVIKLEVSGVTGLTTWANIYHMGQAGGPWTYSELSDLFTAIQPSLEYFYTQNQGVAQTVTLVKMTDLTSDTGAVFEFSADWTGTRSGISAQASACVLLSYQISRRYRGGHPRTYLPMGSAALQNNPSAWDETFIENVLSTFNEFSEACTAHSAEASLGCVSYYSGGALRATPIFEVFTGTTVDSGIKSQRRRLLSTTV